MAVFDTSGDYTQAVLEVVADIPPGRVMTYGDVAWTFGRPGARAVGMVMRFHGSDLPWWRVVRAGGHPPTGHEAAARVHYEEEGTPLVPATTPAGYRIDLAKAAWRPDRPPNRTASRALGLSSAAAAHDTTSATDPVPRSEAT